MSDPRLSEEVVIRGILAALVVRAFVLTPDEMSGLRELLEPYHDADQFDEMSTAVGFLDGEGDPDPEAAAVCLYKYMLHNNLLTLGEAVAPENAWRDAINELRRSRGEAIDPDGPPF